MKTPAPRIVCVAPSWIGDAVLALPALEWLAAGARVEILARASTARVFADAVPADQLHTTSSTRRGRRVADAWRLRRLRPDAAALFAPSFSAAMLGCMSGAPRRVGTATDARRALLTHALPPAGRGVHLALAYQALARATLDALQLAPPDPGNGDGPVGLHALPRLRVRSDERSRATALLESRGISAGQHPLVVAPGAQFGAAKRYPPEKFARAAERLARVCAAPVLLVGTSCDAPHTAAVRAALPAAIDLAGSTDLGTLLAILERAAGVISNDSGVMHLAAAVGVPVVGVFGSTNPGWTGPLGPRSGWVSNPVPCAPCYARSCPIHFECMLGLEPEVLVETLLALMQRHPPAGLHSLRI